MTYFKDENGFVYCYDDRTAVTMVYKYTKWKISKLTYYELKHRAGVEEITEREANCPADVRFRRDISTACQTVRPALLAKIPKEKETATYPSPTGMPSRRPCFN